MSLSDELHSVLTKVREHVAGLVNSGMLVTIDGHLDRLAAAAEGGIQAADDAAKGLLLEAYTALHGAPPAAPAEEPPATVPVIVGEPGPELAVDSGTVIADPAFAAVAPVEESQAPETDAPQAG